MSRLSDFIPQTGATEITGLNDTPSSYDSGKYLRSTSSGTEWATVSGLITESSHGDLTDLGVDDHTIYALADGTRDFTGNVTLSGNVNSPLIIRNYNYNDGGNAYASFTANTDVGSALFGIFSSTYNNSGQTFLQSRATVMSTGSGIALAAYDDGDIKFYTDTPAIERMVIDNDGNVGIGTDNPLNLLHVHSDTGYAGIQVQSTVSGQARGIRLVEDTDNQTVINRYGGEDSPADSFMIEHKVDGNWTGRIIIGDDGNVGIGTTVNDPSYTLDIRDTTGSLNVESTTGTNEVYNRFDNDGGQFYVGREGSAGTFHPSESYASFVWSTQEYPLLFATNNLERMRITSSGSIGIGTDTPQGNMHIIMDNTDGELIFDEAGGSGATIYNPNGYLTLQKNGGAGVTIDDTTGEVIRVTNGKVGIMTDTPDTELDVNGKIFTTSGTASTPAYAFRGDNNTGMWTISDNNLCFSTNGVERLRIDSAGNLNMITSAARILSTDGSVSAPSYSFGNAIDTGLYRVNEDQLGVTIGGTHEMLLEQSGITMEDNLVVKGDLLVSGTRFFTDVETVEIADNLLLLNKGEVGAGVTAGYGGIAIDRGSLNDYHFLFNETQDNFRVGVSGTGLQAVATREDNPTAFKVPYWNNVEYRYDTVSGTIYQKEGDVGVNNSSPDYPLHVLRDTDGYVGVFGKAGGSDAFGVYVNDVGVMLTTFTGDPLRLGVGGNSHVYLNSSGAVGIDTDSMRAKFHLNTNSDYKAICLTNTTASGASKGAAILGDRKDNINNDPFTGFATWDEGTDRRLYLGGGGWGTPDATQIRFYTTTSYTETYDQGLERMRINKSGDIGISNTSEDLAGLLTLGNGADGKSIAFGTYSFLGASYSTAQTSIGRMVRPIVGSAGHEYSYTSVSGSDYRGLSLILDNSGNFKYSAGNYGQHTQGDSFDADANMRFQVNPTGDIYIRSTGSNAQIRFIDSDDNIDGYVYASASQIGFLDDGGSWGYKMATDTNHIWYIDGTQHMILSPGQLGVTDTVTGDKAVFYLDMGNTINRGLYMGAYSNDTYIGAYDNEGSVPTDLLLNPEGGNVGIGEDSPDEKIHVNSGNNNVVANFESTDAISMIKFTDVNGTAELGCGGDNVIFYPAGASEAMRITVSGNVGIGTTSPEARLHVAGPSGGDVGIIIEDQSLGLSDSMPITWKSGSSEFAKIDAFVSASNDVDLRFFTTTDGGLNVDERMRITDDGKVGIGISDPSYRLHVSEDSTGYATVIEQAQGDGNILQLKATASDNQNNDPAFDVDIDASSVFQITNAGNVGIGGTPSQMLDIQEGNVIIQKTDTSTVLGNNKMLRLRNLSATDGNLAEISFDDSDNNTLSAISGKFTNHSSNLGELSFSTRNASGFDERMRIDDVGNIGIGTSGPDGTLHVHTSSAGTVTANGGADNLVVEASDGAGISILTADDQYAILYFGSPSDATGAYAYWNHDNDLMVIGTGNAGAEVRIDAGQYTEMMRIKTSGVGINNTDPLYELDVLNDDGVTSGNHWISRFGRDTGGGDPQLFIGYQANGSVATSSYIRSANNLDLVFGTSGADGISIDGSTGDVTINGDLSVTGSITADSTADVYNTITTTSGNLTKFERHFIDTTSNTVDAYLPSSPSSGDYVNIVDAGGTFATNNLTIKYVSDKIMGLAQDMTASTDNMSFRLVYYNSTRGWILE